MLTDGFLGYRTSFMLDFVVCALVLIVPLLLFSIALARRGRYRAHRLLQTILCIVLLLAVAAFEVDLQIVHGGWENVVARSFENPDLLAKKIDQVRPWLRLHLIFAVTTPLLWIVTVLMAWRRFPSPPEPSEHSRLHVRLGWLSTVDVALTAVTGLIFYYVAFVT